MIKKLFSHSKGKGFTLLEVMVAMMVIVVGLLASLFLIAFTISSGAADKDRIIAIQLAQEGIELIRNIRDDNGWLMVC